MQFRIFADAKPNQIPPIERFWDWNFFESKYVAIERTRPRLRTSGTRNTYVLQSGSFRHACLTFSRYQLRIFSIALRAIHSSRGTRNPVYTRDPKHNRRRDSTTRKPVRRILCPSPPLRLQRHEAPPTVRFPADAAAVDTPQDVVYTRPLGRMRKNTQSLLETP